MSLERTELANQEFESVASPARHIDNIVDLVTQVVEEEEAKLAELKAYLAELTEESIVMGWGRHLEE